VIICLYIGVCATAAKATNKNTTNTIYTSTITTTKQTTAKIIKATQTSNNKHKQKHQQQTT